MTRHVTMMTIDDAEHYSPERRAEIIAGYPLHERDARSKGIPVLGSGAIFPVSDEDIMCAPFQIPAYWPQINGLDFGYDHPFGAVNCAWDRDSDTFYVCKEYSVRLQGPIMHVGGIKPWGDWIPTSWPHDGLQHDKGGSCEELASQYRNLGLNMLPERATFPDGGNGVEAGVLEMLDMMQTGHWKVFSTCGGWFSEKRLYHRKDGQIVKVKDDVLSASRYAFMMRRFAKTLTVKKIGPKMPQTVAGGWQGR